MNDTAAISASTRRYGATDRVAARAGAPRHPREKPCGADDQRRPEQIELLLHTQRPVVLKRRRRRIGRQVVGALDREAVVADIQRAGDAVTDHAACLQRRQQHRRCDARRDRAPSPRQAAAVVPARRRTGPAAPCPALDASRHSRPVIRNPETTKNTSTPMNPPPTPGRPAWNRTTARTATARRPSMSGRNCFCGRAARPLAGDTRREAGRGAVATLFTRATIVSRDPGVSRDQRATSPARPTLAAAFPATPPRHDRRRRTPLTGGLRSDATNCLVAS